MTYSKWTVLLLSAACFLSPGTARAAFVGIDDFSIEGTIRFRLNDFEGGFFINGVLVQQGLNSPTTVDVPENGTTIVFTADWITSGLVPVINSVVFLDSPSATTASDILKYTYTANTTLPGGHLAGSFLSDVEGGTDIAIPPSAQRFLESNGVFDFSNGNITAQAQSDVEAVPEPASMAIWGLGALGCAVAGYRRRKQAG